jgi:hypothetical protein
MSPGIDSSQVEQVFISALASRNLKLSEPLIGDGKRHRCDGANGQDWHGENDGAYVLHRGGLPAGALINYRDGRGWQRCKFDIGIQRDCEEYRRLAREAQASRPGSLPNGTGWRRRPRRRRKVSGMRRNRPVTIIPIFARKACDRTDCGRMTIS